MRGLSMSAATKKTNKQSAASIGQVWVLLRKRGGGKKGGTGAWLPNSGARNWGHQKIFGGGGSGPAPHPWVKTQGGWAKRNVGKEAASGQGVCHKSTKISLKAQKQTTRGSARTRRQLCVTQVAR